LKPRPRSQSKVARRFLHGLVLALPVICVMLARPYHAVLQAATLEPVVLQSPTHEPVFVVADAGSAGLRLTWPTDGPVTSNFDDSHPLGIDIGLAFEPNEVIRASADGTISFAGGRRCCSYGLYVIVDHANDLTTLYAHLSEIWVEEGQHVKAGEALGRGGTTGTSTSEHLHFEVRKAGIRIDPLAFLPRDLPPGE
jgi:murein DD-endopeptidase MepM/ murein hydrolase activator NlpD